MARPPKPINWDLVIAYMESGRTQDFIARKFNIHPTNFRRQFKKEFGDNFTRFASDFLSDGPENIHAMQYFKAIGLTTKGDNKMLELLGREWLGQGKEEIKESPFQEDIDTRHELMILRSKTRKLEEMLNAYQSKAGEELRGSDSSL